MSYLGAGTAEGPLHLTSPTTAPAVSPAGEGRIFFNGTIFQVSENGGVYVQLGTATTGGGWTDDGTVVRLTTSTDQVGIGTAAPAATAKAEVAAGAFATGLLVSGGTISSPGAGASSERFGAGALAVGGSATAVGNTASAGGVYSVAVGILASASFNGAIAIGRSTTASNSATVGLGHIATASGAFSNAIGYFATASGNNSISIGPSSVCAGVDAISIGAASNVAALAVSGIAIGKTARIQTAVPAAARSIAIGENTTVDYPNCIALGYLATPTAANQCVVGSASAAITEFVFGASPVSGTPPALVTWRVSDGAASIGSNLTIRAGNANGAFANGTLALADGTGGSGGVGSVVVQSAGATRLTVSSTALTSTVPLLFSADNTLDIGVSGATRPASIYLRGSLVAQGAANQLAVSDGAVAQSAGGLTITSTAAALTLAATGANVVDVKTNGVVRTSTADTVFTSSVNVAPNAAGSLDLGVANTGWKRLYLDSAIDTTAGVSATINKAAGRFRKDTTGTTFTLTNSYVTAASIILLTFVDTDATATSMSVVAGVGSAVVTFNAAPTANVNVNFLVINAD